MTNSTRKNLITFGLLLSTFFSLTSNAGSCPVQNRDGQVTRVVGNFPGASANFDAILVSNISVGGADYVWCASEGTLAFPGITRENSIRHFCQPSVFNVPFEASARIVTAGQSNDLRVKGWSLNCPPTVGPLFEF